MGLNYNFSTKPADSTVKVSFDESIKGTALHRTKEEIEELKKAYYGETSKQGIGKNKTEQMGFESSLQKEERINKLKVAIEQQKVVTVTSAVKYMGLGRETVLKYLAEIKLPVFDDKKGVWLYSEEG